MSRLVLGVVVVVSRVCVAACDSPPQHAITTALAPEMAWSITNCQQGDLNGDGLADFVFTLSSTDTQLQKVAVVLANRDHTYLRVATTAEWSAVSKTMNSAQIQGQNIVLSASGAQSACSFGSTSLNFRPLEGQFVLVSERHVHKDHRCPSLHQPESETGSVIDYATNTATYWRHQGNRKVRKRLSFHPQSPVPLSDFDITQYGLDLPTDRALRGYIDNQFKLRFSE